MITFFYKYIKSFTLKVLKINTSILFNLVFAKNTILSSSFSFFLIIDLYFLIPTVIAQFFNPITELVIPIGMSSKGAKAEIETHYSTILFIFIG